MGLVLRLGRGFVGGYFVDRKGFGGLVGECGGLWCVSGVRGRDFRGGDDMGFDADHRVEFRPVACFEFPAVFR